jgi:MinD-like ATPase involved in chromosome partitioning or flagellar assembly
VTQRNLSQRQKDVAASQMIDPETMTINIDLPATVHLAPEDELAVAIDDTAVSPDIVDVARLTTKSITIVTGPIVVEVEPEPEAPVIPPLPLNDFQSARDLESTRDLQAARDAQYTRRDRLRGEPSPTPESASMLTAERLVQPRVNRRIPPEGRWPRFVYTITLHLVNLGDSPKVRARKAIDARIDKVFEGGTRFVPILTRKGGVGKTTVTTLLGMALATVREDRIIAIDANPDRGTLAERISKASSATVRDVVLRAPEITSVSDFGELVSRDETRLDVLASDVDPHLSEAFDEDDYNVVADQVARYYSIALTDCGTGIVHSVMRATLQRADSLVIVSGGSVDEARLASETLTWLETNGYGDLVKNAIVTINTATQGTNLVKLDEIEAHFISRVRAVVKIPYDPQLATGSVINYRDLKPFTRESARELAALVVDGLPVRRDS